MTRASDSAAPNIAACPAGTKDRGAGRREASHRVRGSGTEASGGTRTAGFLGSAFRPSRIRAVGASGTGTAVDAASPSAGFGVAVCPSATAAAEPVAAGCGLCRG
ncbi:hypothetical protein ACWEP2_32440, partial [Streptomyces sp. NPDC004279]